MLWPLIEMGSLFFFLLLGAFSLFECGLLFNKKDGEALLLFIVAVVLSVVLVSGWNKLSWVYLAGYFSGGVVWVPAYWYLQLRRNFRKLSEAKSDHQREMYGEPTEWEQDPTKSVAWNKTGAPIKWIPKHPDNDELFANGVVWPISAPCFLAHDWILIVVDFYRGLMDRIRKSMVVGVE